MTNYKQAFYSNYETCNLTLQKAVRDVCDNFKHSSPSSFKLALGVSGVVLTCALAPHVAALATSLGITAKLLASAGFVQHAAAVLVALAQTTLGWAASLLPYSSQLAGQPVLTQMVGAAVTSLSLGGLFAVASTIVKSARDLVENTQLGRSFLPIRFRTNESLAKHPVSTSAKDLAEAVAHLAPEKQDETVAVEAAETTNQRPCCK